MPAAKFDGYDVEWSARKSSRLTRLIRNAGYADPAACVENIEYQPERRLVREQILRLASCTYLQKAHDVIILGPTGAGKTYLACALGMAPATVFTLCGTSACWICWWRFLWPGPTEPIELT